MTNQPIYEYEILVKVERKHLMTIPIADFYVQGRFRRQKDFADQLGESFAERLARIRPKLEKARKY